MMKRNVLLKKQSVRHNETTCSIKGNTLFAIENGLHIKRAYKEKLCKSMIHRA